MSKKEVHIENVEVMCKATSDGYFNGRIVKDGSNFLFTGILQDGKFPLWCVPVKEYKAEFFKKSKAKPAVKPVVAKDLI